MRTCAHCKMYGSSLLGVCATKMNTALALTAGVCIKEPDGGSNEGAEHAVVQHPRGIDTDEVEQCGADEVEDDGSESDPSVDAHPLVIIQVADRLDTPVAHLKDSVVDDGTVRPGCVWACASMREGKGGSLV